MKPILSILDLLLRAAAAITVLGICVAAVFVGTMAGLTGPFAIILPTIVLSIWILLSAFNPTTISRRLPLSAAWRFVLIKLPVYAVACVGILYGIYQWRVRYGTPSVMISKGDPQFPADNPSSNKILEITGTLPLTVPVKDLIAIYTADANSTHNSSSACTRRQDFMPTYTNTYPLVHIEHIPIVRTGETYRSSVAVDRFSPGFCGWHLNAVTYLLEVKGYSENEFAYWRASAPRVELLTYGQDRERSNQPTIHAGRADVWCWKVTNHESNPFRAVRCGDLEAALKWPGQHVTAVSGAERAYGSVAYARPESSSVQFNFHDFDAPSHQFIQPPTQVRESPTPATNVLPSRVNVGSGVPVSLSIGESLEDVKAAFGNREQVKPARSATYANTQSLTIRDRGVRVFFDESKKVYRIRIDAPFTGQLGGRDIIRTREALERAPGGPAKQIQRPSGMAGSSFISDIDASTKVRYDFDPAGRVIAVFLLSGTLKIMPDS